MDSKSIAALLASLASTPLVLGCDKTQSQATDVPEHHDAGSGAEGEHACGNHAEGACGSERSDEASAQGLERSFELATNGFAEVNIRMAAGTKFFVSFEGGSADLTWNVHSHDHSGQTRVHDGGKAGEGRVDFAAPDDGVFSVLWKNPGASTSSLRVRVSVTEGASLHSWVPAQ